MTMYREPNRQGAPFPEGLPLDVETALVAMNAVTSINPEEVGLKARNWELETVVPKAFQEKVDELMFDWLNDNSSPQQLKYNKYGLNSPREQQQWMSRLGVLDQFNAYIYGSDGLTHTHVDQELVDALQPMEGNFPIVFEDDNDPEDGEKQEDRSGLLVVRGDVHFGFEVDTHAFSQLRQGKIKKIVPVLLSDAGFSWAYIKADLYDRYSELYAGDGSSRSIHPDSIGRRTAMQPDGKCYNAINLSQALTLALTLPEGFKVNYDATEATTKTDALIRRAADLLLRPIQPSSEGYGGSDINSSVVVLKGMHALLSRHATHEHRDIGNLADFVAEELTRSRHFPKGSRDKPRNFTEYAELAVQLAKPLDMTPKRVLNAIHKVAPK